MARLAPVTFENLDDAQRTLWDNITSGPRGTPIGRTAVWRAKTARWLGPFNALFYSPEVGDAVQKLGAALRYSTSLPADLLEVAILTVGGEWAGKLRVLGARAPGRGSGRAPAAIDSIGDGETPSFDDPRHQIVYEFGRELIETKRVSDECYEALKALVGERGVFEVASVMGYYGLVSIGLNAFNVGMPPGVEAPFAD